jgi:hypothetical protein
MNTPNIYEVIQYQFGLYFENYQASNSANKECWK